MNRNTIFGEHEIKRGFLKKIKRVKTKPHKQGTLNHVRMLEHHIQHRRRAQNMLEHCFQHQHMNICFSNNEANTDTQQNLKSKAT